MMKWLGVVALVAISQLTAAYDLPTKPVSMRLQSAGVREILENLLVDSGFAYDIDPKIGNERKISVSAQGQWSKVFRKILADQDLTFGFDRAGKILVMRN